MLFLNFLAPKSAKAKGVGIFIPKKLLRTSSEFLDRVTIGVIFWKFFKIEFFLKNSRDSGKNGGKSFSEEKFFKAKKDNHRRFLKNF